MNPSDILLLIGAAGIGALFISKILSFLAAFMGIIPYISILAMGWQYRDRIRKYWAVAAERWKTIYIGMQQKKAAKDKHQHDIEYLIKECIRLEQMIVEGNKRLSYNVHDQIDRGAQQILEQKLDPIMYNLKKSIDIKFDAQICYLHERLRELERKNNHGI